MSRIKKPAALLLFVAAVTAGAWTVAALSRPNDDVTRTASSAGSAPSTQGTPGTSGTPGTLISFADVVSRVSPGVVTIRTERRASMERTEFPNSPFDWFGQIPRGRAVPRVERGLGSGVIVDREGRILTNNHVIDGATGIRVELADGRTFDGKLVGADAPSDLAVVKIDAKDLPLVAVGDSDRIRVGDVVLALGNPLGVGQTVTMGIVSAKGRATGLGDGSYEDFLQTDAPINEGNSGGALVNTSGELIGINSQILTPSGGNIGLGFAVPSNMAKNVMQQLISVGEVRRGKLGVTVQTLTGDLAAGLGLKDTRGALVSDVTDGSAAARAGLKRGDLITRFEGRPVADSNSLRNEVAGTKPGTDVALQVLRDGKTLDLKARLDALSAPRPAASRGARREGAGRYGMTVQPVTPELAERLDLPRQTRGVVITDLDPTGQAASAGLREGDVIQQVNGKPVASGDELRAGLEAANDRPAVLLVDRQGATIFVPVRAPRG
jgi:Do/DeqQ family serine protease